MGGCDIVLGAKWLRTLGTITMDFLELHTSFQKDGNSYMLKGIKEISPKIISSHHMENILKRVIVALLHNSMLFNPSFLHYCRILSMMGLPLVVYMPMVFDVTKPI
jgi:hypothetical protein